MRSGAEGLSDDAQRGLLVAHDELSSNSNDSVSGARELVVAPRVGANPPLVIAAVDVDDEP